MSSRKRKIGQTITGGDDGTKDLCAWLDCEHFLTTLYRLRIWEGTSPQGGGPIYSWKYFCSHRHMMYYVNAPRDHQNLPPGYRLAI